MNVDKIYQLQRDEAFADQFEDTHYRTFVAMPFSSRGGYPAKRIREILSTVHDLANVQVGILGLSRTFAPVERVDDGDPAAVVITDEIIQMILGHHFFVGDLTGANHGVLLESGIAFALKPNSRVVLFSQDGANALHFDLKVTNVIAYTEDDLAEKVADSLIRAAMNYEEEAARYITQISSRLSPSAHVALNIFGRQYRDYKEGDPLPSLFEKLAEVDERFRDAPGQASFEAAARELLMHRLMWTHWEAGVGKGKDAYGLHATKLGWRVIEHIWKHDGSIKMPPNARTGPNVAVRGPRFAYLTKGEQNPEE